MIFLIAFPFPSQLYIYFVSILKEGSLELGGGSRSQSCKVGAGTHSPAGWHTAVAISRGWMHAIRLPREALRVPVRIPAAGAAPLQKPTREITQFMETGRGGEEDSPEPVTVKPPQAFHAFENGPERDAIRRHI